MIEAYSSNVTTAIASPIPFNNVSLVKGCTVQQQNVNTFVFNKKGIYKVEFNASAATTGTSGNIVAQMYTNGVLQPQAWSEADSTATTDVQSLEFSTLVQVPEDNTSCCTSVPTTIQIQNTGVAALYSTANIVITKLC